VLEKSKKWGHGKQKNGEKTEKNEEKQRKKRAF
jgi:hypothetical protein